MTPVEKRLEKLVTDLLYIIRNVSQCQSCASCKEMALNAIEFSGYELELIKKEREREAS